MTDRSKRDFLDMRGKQTGVQRRNQEEIKKELEAKEQRLKAYRKEASRLASMANKRIKRLEKNDLKDTPAYQSLLVSGKDYKEHPKFQVRGKDYNELQKEVARMNKFLNSNTSTVRGAHNLLKEMAKNTGIKYKNLKELKSKSKMFFGLASKIEQYLRTVEDMASAIGYQKIWQQINKYVQENGLNLDGSEHDIEDLTMKIVNAMDIYDEKTSFGNTNDGYFQEGWFTLKKE